MEADFTRWVNVFKSNISDLKLTTKQIYTRKRERERERERERIDFISMMQSSRSGLFVFNIIFHVLIETDYIFSFSNELTFLNK